MIVIDKYVGVVHRALSLKYYKTAFSEAGARITGGRFNRISQGGLYLGLSPTASVAEYIRRGDPRPLVIVSANVVVENVIDITGDLSSWPSHWKNWECDWEKARDQSLLDPSVTCSSWQCRDEVVAMNGSGILYPSRMAPGENNLVIFQEDSIAGSVSVGVIDPDGEMRGANPIRI